MDCVIPMGKEPFYGLKSERWNALHDNWLKSKKQISLVARDVWQAAVSNSSGLTRKAKQRIAQINWQEVAQITVSVVGSFFWIAFRIQEPITRACHRWAQEAAPKIALVIKTLIGIAFFGWCVQVAHQSRPVIKNENKCPCDYIADGRQLWVYEASKMWSFAYNSQSLLLDLERAENQSYGKGPRERYFAEYWSSAFDLTLFQNKREFPLLADAPSWQSMVHDCREQGGVRRLNELNGGRIWRYHKSQRAGDVFIRHPFRVYAMPFQWSSFCEGHYNLFSDFDKEAPDSARLFDYLYRLILQQDWFDLLDEPDERAEWTVMIGERQFALREVARCLSRLNLYYRGYIGDAVTSPLAKRFFETGHCPAVSRQVKSTGSSQECGLKPSHGTSEWQQFIEEAEKTRTFVLDSPLFLEFEDSLHKALSQVGSLKNSYSEHPLFRAAYALRNYSPRTKVDSPVEASVIFRKGTFQPLSLPGTRLFSDLTILWMAHRAAEREGKVPDDFEMRYTNKTVKFEGQDRDLGLIADCFSYLQSYYGESMATAVQSRFAFEFLKTGKCEHPPMASLYGRIQD